MSEISVARCHVDPASSGITETQWSSRGRWKYWQLDRPLRDSYIAPIYWNIHARQASRVKVGRVHTDTRRWKWLLDVSSIYSQCTDIDVCRYVVCQVSISIFEQIFSAASSSVYTLNIGLVRRWGCKVRGFESSWFRAGDRNSGWVLVTLYIWQWKWISFTSTTYSLVSANADF